MPQVDPSFQSLTHDAEVIEADAHGPKVLLLSDGSYLKVFRRKRLLSSALWSPYAQRFADNATKLKALGIPCPSVLRVYHFAIINTHVVHYLPLPGQTLRHVIRHTTDARDLHTLRQQLGPFVASLHEQGVYFRSIHLGNVILGDDGRLGLIDIADMKIHRCKLSSAHRKRNLAHLLRYAEDCAWLLADGGRAFAQAYTAVSTNAFRDIEICAQLLSSAGRHHRTH